MDVIVGYMSVVLQGWISALSSPHELATIAFLLLLLVLDIARRGWRFSWPLRAVKGVFATITLFHLNFVLTPLIWLAIYWFNSTYTSLNLPAIPSSLWVGIPAWALVIIGLVSHDFSNYWVHRLMHTRWFWPTHAIHHSEPDVNGLSAFRIHFLEAFLMYGSYALLFTWMGIPADTTGIGAIFVSLQIIYVHADLDWDHGPFKLLFASPRFHRWHHADVPEAHGKNLANMFPFFDWMFGTYVNHGSRDTPLGAKGVPENDVVGLMMFPFTEWGRMGVASTRRVTAKLSSVSAKPVVQEPDAVPAGD